MIMNLNHNNFDFKSWSKKVGIASLTVFILSFSFFAGVFSYAKIASFVAVKDTNPSTSGNTVIQGTNGKVDFSPFWKVWSEINDNFVGTTTSTTTDEARLHGAIKGMVASLGDPYTTFFTPEENTNFETELAGSLEGVGMVVGIKEKQLVVISPVKNSPASKAGVLAGDKIVLIDGKDTAGISVEEAVKLIRGKKGTQVKITFERDGSKLEKALIRDLIVVPAVETERVDSTTLIIKINTFSSNVANEFRVALREFITGGYTKMIIDLRDNPGGYLDAAVDMTSWFVSQGKIIVTEDFGTKRDAIIYRSKGYDLFNPNFRIVVLINKGSASASEIFAGALSEYGIATLVGEQSFGKGSVQEVVPITNNTSLKITVAKWLTPKGKSLAEGGLKPDFVVEMKEEDYKAGRDPQKQKAIDLIKGF